ncbi:MAG: MBL fold metallo-hydrolase [Clostridia bacterium]|nr:MBL fold metallo-hydrolase [Clostridia bacterium]
MNGQDFLSDTNLKINANDDDIEISVFGRGFGECIVLCCGNKEYVVIDSFVNPQTKKPIAIDYLNALGISTKSIKKVILTHWHSDHISGAVDILNVAAPDVQLVVSPIISEKRFMEYISLGKESCVSSTSEFVKIYEYIEKNGIQHVCLAKEKTRVYSNESLSNAEIYCLFPHDTNVIDYLNSIILPKTGDPVAYEYKDENLLSIVLLMKYSSDGALFGGDLEVSQNNDGWSAIVNNYEHHKNYPSIFKIPHHGSVNAHCELVWRNILQPNPISILTVYNKGNKLPKDSDIDRIKSLSGALYIVGKKSKEDKAFEHDLKRSMPKAKVNTMPQEIGLIRYRKNRFKPDEAAKIETFGSVQIYSK